MLLQLLYHHVDIRNGLLEKKGRLSDRLEQVAGQIRAILEEGKAEGLFDPAISTGLMLLTFMRALSLSGHEQLLMGEQLSPRNSSARLDASSLKALPVRNKK